VPHNFIPDHFDLLLSTDRYFRQYWEHLGQGGQDELIRLLSSIEQLPVNGAELLAEHLRISRLFARYMVRVQDVPFDYMRLSADWPDIACDEREKLLLFTLASERLDQFLIDVGLHTAIRLYGSIKSTEALTRRMMAPKTEDQFRRALLDTWDVVRFRMIAADLSALRQLALTVWEELYEAVIRCRNYYFRPKDDDHGEPYRGVHFELELQAGRVVEVQLLTRAREMIGWLDHGPLFKRAITLPSPEHEAWMWALSRKANVYEHKLLKPE
jgi:hypothetical protein